MLVHCAQGKSRSGTVSVAYVAATLGLSVEKSLELVQRGRRMAHPNHNFMQQLLAFERSGWLRQQKLPPQQQQQQQRGTDEANEPSPPPAIAEPEPAPEPEPSIGPAQARITVSGDASSLESFSRRLVPFMPPRLQQQVASDPTLLSGFVCLRDDSSTAAAISVTIDGANYQLDQLSSHEALQTALEKASPSTLWGAAATDGGDSGESHSVLSAGVGATAALLSSRQPPVEVRVAYAGAEEATASAIHLLPALTGLQMKSAVIAGLGLTGGFQDYYLRCEGGAFGSRTAISTHPGFGEGCLLEIEDVGSRPKAVGHT
eukprot:COSAG01_NODE_9714_length_2363_cov_8.026060_1_plen_317_part_00